MNFSVLPNLIALAILVAVFRAILRQGTNERLHLWLCGWILVLVHFAAQFLDTGQGTWSQVATAISLDALLLAGVAFLISVSTIVDSDRRRQILFAAAVAVPALAYTDAVIWQVTAPKFLLWHGCSGADRYYPTVLPLLWPPYPLCGERSDRKLRHCRGNYLGYCPWNSRLGH